MYDAADTIVGQKLMQLEGVGNVIVGGGSQPAVRVELHPQQLSNYGISLEDVRNVITNTNVNRPKGFLQNDEHAWKVEANDQAKKAADYQPLIVSYKNGKAVRLSDIADVNDSVRDLRNAGMVGDQPCVMLIIFREPGANIIETVGRINDIMPQLRASIPEAINLNLVMDRTADDPQFPARSRNDTGHFHRARHSGRFPLLAERAGDSDFGHFRPRLACRDHSRSCIWPTFR